MRARAGTEQLAAVVVASGRNLAWAPGGRTGKHAARRARSLTTRVPGALGDSDATGRVNYGIRACADEEPVAAQMCAPRGSQLFRSVMDDRVVE